MKTKILYRMAIAVAVTGIVYACNKSNSSSTPPPGQTTTELQVAADDNARANNETDAVENDVTVTLSSPGASNAAGASYRGQVETSGITPAPINSLICDASVTIDSVDNPRTVTITYNGSNCNGTRTRTGIVVVTWPAGQRWSTAGATVTVNIQNLVITRLSDSKTITLNGTHVYTNVSGGSLIDLADLGSITHTDVGDSMTITFDDGTQRLWNFARQRVYTYTDGVVVTTTGLHTDGTLTGIAAWGTNRYGVTFQTLITTPMVIAQSCDFRLTAGAHEILRSDNFTTTITYGLNAQGAPTSCPGTGTYYYEATWTGPHGGTGSVILPY
jgi:hypothetical protein